MSNSIVQIGVIIGIHGIKGGVKILCFTEKPQDIMKFKKIYDANGFVYKIDKVISYKKNEIVVYIKGISSPNIAKLLLNKILMVDRTDLPYLRNSEFYYCDIIGSTVILFESNVVLGVVQNIFTSGATEVLEIFSAETNKLITYPFSKNFISEINTSEKYIIVLPIEEI